MKGPPPVEQWSPPFSGVIDMRIARDGRWYHEGRELRRPELVRLFSSILRREKDGSYCLVTPAECWRLEVEDVPFLGLRLERQDDWLFCITNVEDRVRIDTEHPLQMRETGQGLAPYLRVRGGLEARLVRNAFYALVEEGKIHRDGQTGEENLIVHSGDCRFSLGAISVPP